MARISIKTLGCKVNSYDTSALSTQLEARSHEVVSDREAADAIIINSCSVTANAEKEARYLARRYKREAPERPVIIAGCYAQTDSGTLAGLASVDFVIPNSVKDQSVEHIDHFLAGHYDTKLPPEVDSVTNNRQSHFKSSLTLFAATKRDRARAFIKIQDGCDGFCSYCLIPYARGSSRSVEPELIINSVAQLASEGVKEIVITGIHVGDYGRDLDCYAGVDYPIAPLLEEVLSLPGFRLRISSLEPSEVSDELVAVLSAYSDRICPHFHLPLQSANDDILEKMRRTYSTQEYLEACEKLRLAFPNLSIGADVIPGFPGESDAQHRDTMEFCESAGLSYLHVFPYSQRPNTSAAKMPGHLDPTTIKNRAKELRDLSTRLVRRYGNAHLNRTLPVIWDDQTDALGRQRGRTDNYLQVVADASSESLPGQISDVVLSGWVSENTLLGRHCPT